VLVGSVLSTVALAQEVRTRPDPAPTVDARDDDFDRGDGASAVVDGTRSSADSEELEFGAVAEVELPPAARHSSDPSVAGTSVDVGRATEIATLFASVPGARPFVTGPVGSYVGLSLRGAELGHTTVVLDDLPLAGPDTGAFDFSLIPLGAIERVEVFRGGAPAWLGDGSIGGVVRLLSARPTTRRWTTTGAVGAGSFGLWSARGSLGASNSTLSSVTAVGLRSSRGDHPYLDDGGTRLRADDDVERRRTNAETFDAELFGSFTARLARGELRLVYLGMSRHQGEPGPAAAPARLAMRRRHRGFVGVTWERLRDRGRLQLALGGGYDRNRFFDPWAEIGTGRFDSDDRTMGGFARLAGEWSVAPRLDLTTVLNVRYDANRPRDAWVETPQNQARRITSTATLEARAHGRLRRARAELRPSVRLLHTHASTTTVVLGAPIDDRRASWLPTGRVGAVVAPRAWLSIVGSYARGARLPTFLELFGDRGLLLASPSLAPERSQSVDFGLQLRGRRGAVTGSFEARAFVLSLRELIRYRRTAQYTAIAENVDRGRSHGVELGGDLELGRHLRWSVAWTELRTSTDGGREQPLRPRRLAQLRGEVRLGSRGRLEELALDSTLSVVGDAFADPANLVRLRSRAWVDLGVRFELRRPAIALVFAMRDVLDRRGTDLLGYPVPGRRVDLLLEGRLSGT
jgi:iron complex outermembrane receptor protein